MRLVITNDYVEELEETELSFKTVNSRNWTDKEKNIYEKAVDFVNNCGVNELAKHFIVETDDDYDENNIDTVFSCLIVDTDTYEYYIELSERTYPVEHIRVLWNDYYDEFELYQE